MGLGVLFGGVTAFLELIIWIILLVVFFSKLNRVISLLQEVVSGLRLLQKSKGTTVTTTKDLTPQEYYNRTKPLPNESVSLNTGQYKVYIDGKVRGPYTPQEIGSFSWFSQDTLVCPGNINHPTQDDWKKAGDIQELRMILTPTWQGKKPPPPPTGKFQ